MLHIQHCLTFHCRLLSFYCETNKYWTVVPSAWKQIYLPKPLDLFRVARVVTIYCTGFPVIDINLLHATQHQLHTTQQIIDLIITFKYNKTVTVVWLRGEQTFCVDGNAWFLNPDIQLARFSNHNSTKPSNGWPTHLIQKVGPYWITSTRLRADHGFLAVSPQVT